MAFRLLFSILLLLWTTASFASSDDFLADDHSKYTVCTATLNSENERELFKKKLSPRDFKFVELTTLGKDPAQWFEAACKSGVQCDVLLISGHFGGKFFGSTKLELPLDTLESHSCNQDCDGILMNPKEVFLFGCNTLATKKKDARTPEQYYQVLLEDHYTPAQAEQFVEERYGVLGDSNRARMQRVFRHSPHIYGFYSVGPSGKNVQGYLSKYLNKKKNYAQHLDKLGVQTIRGALSDLNHQETNQDLKTSMKGTAYSECGGSDFYSTNDEIMETNCKIRNEKLPLAERLELIKYKLSASDFLVYIDAIQSFFDKLSVSKLSSEEKAILAEIRSEEGNQKKFKHIIETHSLPSVRYRLAALAHQLGWYADADYREQARSVLKRLFKAPVTTENKDLICSLKTDSITESALRAEDLDGSVFVTEDGLSALGCSAPSDHNIHLKMTSAFKTSSDPEIKKSILRAFASVPVDASETEIINTHLRLAGDPESPYRYLALRTFRVSSTRDPRIEEIAWKALDDEDEDIVMASLRLVSRTDVPKFNQKFDELIHHQSHLVEVSAAIVFASVATDSRADQSVLYRCVFGVPTFVDLDARKTCLRALAGTNRQSTWQGLLPKENIEETALKLLEQKPSADGLLALEVLAKHPDPGVREKASELLTKAKPSPSPSPSASPTKKESIWHFF